MKGSNVIHVGALMPLLFLSGCFQVSNPNQAGTNGVSTITPAAHNVPLQGVNHADNYCKPDQFCASCHGVQLKGGANGEPSCFQCHGALWKTCGQNVTHDIIFGGSAHAQGYCEPLTNCSSCHGNQLKGGTNGEPSCFKCHGELWKNCGQNTSHSVDIGGVFHAPGFCSPYVECSACHGTVLHGGANGEPSCLQCHTQQVWKNCGSVQHSRSAEGVLHALDWCKPATDCTPCHGSNLQGGPNQEPSCFQCHGDKWTKGCGGEGGDQRSGASLLFHTGLVHPSGNIATSRNPQASP